MERNGRHWLIFSMIQLFRSQGAADIIISLYHYIRDNKNHGFISDSNCYRLALKCWMNLRNLKFRTFHLLRCSQLIDPMEVIRHKPTDWRVETFAPRNSSIPSIICVSTDYNRYAGTKSHPDDGNSRNLEDERGLCLIHSELAYSGWNLIDNCASRNK
jgi:hypothetical protein